MEKRIQDFMNYASVKNIGENEFLQAVEEVAEVIIPFMESNPKYNNTNLLERIIEPERVVIFRVPWLDDKGKNQVNKTLYQECSYACFFRVVKFS